MVDATGDGETPTARHSRRRVLRGAVGGAGLLALSAGGALEFRRAAARSDDDDSGDDDDNSGPGGGDGENSGHGGGNDNDAPAITGAVPAGSVAIQIVNDDADGFSPATLTIDAGQSVTFVNAHSDPHTATGSGFDTGIIDPGGIATVVLDDPGTFAYACQIHPEMTGRIGVRGPDGTVPPPAQVALPADATVVEIVNFAFVPPLLSVPLGTTVAWTNADTAPHTATALDGAFDSDILDPGGGFSFAFTAPGTFAYRCNLHPQMEGTVTVGDQGAATDTAAPAVTPTPDRADVADAVPADPVGTWTVVLNPASGADLAPQWELVTLRADGTLTASYAAIGDAGGRLGAALGAGHGVWADVDGGFRATTVALILDEAQGYVGTLYMLEAGRLEDTGAAYDGAVNFAAIDADGQPLTAGEATTRGERIALVADATPAATRQTGQAAPLAVTVTIRDFAFDPPSVEVPVGATVIWVNDGDAPHSATAADGRFDTGRLDPAQDGQHIFAEPGTYAYRCDFHPEMLGTVVVG